MNRIYCLDCERFFLKEKTGFTVALDDTGGSIVVRGDLYKCPGCGREVYGDFGEPYEVRK